MQSDPGIKGYILCIGAEQAKWQADPFLSKTGYEALYTLIWNPPLRHSVTWLCLILSLPSNPVTYSLCKLHFQATSSLPLALRMQTMGSWWTLPVSPVTGTSSLWTIWRGEENRGAAHYVRLRGCHCQWVTRRRLDHQTGMQTVGQKDDWEWTRAGAARNTTDIFTNSPCLSFSLSVCFDERQHAGRWGAQRERINLTAQLHSLSNSTAVSKLHWRWSGWLMILSFAGFRMMEKFGLIEKEYGTIPGVSLEPGSFNSFPCYRLHRDALVSQPTRWVVWHAKWNITEILWICFTHPSAKELSMSRRVIGRTDRSITLKSSQISQTCG